MFDYEEFLLVKHDMAVLLCAFVYAKLVTLNLYSNLLYYLPLRVQQSNNTVFSFYCYITVIKIASV